MCATVREEKKKPSPRRSAAAMEVWRKRRRAGVVPKFSGLQGEGIDKEGNRVLTRRLNSMGIYEPYKGVVRVHFRRNGRGPKTIVITDVYHAVRMTKHIEEGYVKELDKNDRILKSISIENLKLARGGKNREGIEEAIRNIKIILKSLKGIRIPKKTFSREQLKYAISYLEDAIKDEDRIDGRKIGMACAKIVSFRTRYGNWRDREVIAIKEYSNLRGYGLRKLRDERVLFNVSNWMRYLNKEKKGFQMRALWLRDLKFSDELEKLVENKRKMKPEKLGEISKKLFDAGYNNKKIDRAYEALIWRDEKKARKLVKEYMLLLRVRNPLYIAREMEKETDKYYHKAAGYLKSAAKLIERKIFNRAVYCFEKAAEGITERGPKSQTSLNFPSQSQQ